MDTQELKYSIDALDNLRMSYDDGQVTLRGQNCDIDLGQHLLNVLDAASSTIYTHSYYENAAGERVAAPAATPAPADAAGAGLLTVSAGALENLLYRAGRAHEGPYLVEINGSRQRWFLTNGGSNVLRRLESEFELDEHTPAAAERTRATDAYMAAADPQTVASMARELLALRATLTPAPAPADAASAGGPYSRVWLVRDLDEQVVGIYATLLAAQAGIEECRSPQADPMPADLYEIEPFKLEGCDRAAPTPAPATAAPGAAGEAAVMCQCAGVCTGHTVRVEADRTTLLAQIAAHSDLFRQAVAVFDAMPNEIYDQYVPHNMVLAMRGKTNPANGIMHAWKRMLAAEAALAAALAASPTAPVAPEAGPVGGLFLQGDPTTNPFGPR